MTESPAAPTVAAWTGREVRALRIARRMSLREFAEHLGVSQRVVSKWKAPEALTKPRPVNQQALDTSLALANAETHARFRTLRRRRR